LLQLYYNRIETEYIIELSTLQYVLKTRLNLVRDLVRDKIQSPCDFCSKGLLYSLMGDDFDAGGKKWFKAKRYGYGLEPASKEGWGISFAFITLIALLSILSDIDSSGNYDWAIAVFVFIFLIVVAIKSDGSFLKAGGRESTDGNTEEESEGVVLLNDLFIKGEKGGDDVVISKTPEPATAGYDKSWGAPDDNDERNSNKPIKF